ncbi:class I SAM-dependent methyltransferase [Micromonospora sp. CA-263727]|uniref:class I SAM-dependent methyltransferase n=1 Tax=Micromonospora sp. CA-263727 TaxID=3239967 RepID=UPI003D933F87
MSEVSAAELFAGTGEHYVRHRVAYPPELIAPVVEATRCLAPGRVVDIGSGPGTVALALAECGVRVVAVDAACEMLGWGRRLAAERGVGGVEWVVANAERLALRRGAGLVGATIGDAFHWMDRAAVLRGLDSLLSPRGAFVAVLSRRAPGAPRPAWHAAVRVVRDRYLAGHGAAVARGYGRRLREGHEVVLRRSAFAVVTEVTAVYAVAYTLDEVVGRQLSKAFSSRAVLGERRTVFEADMRESLLALEPSGRFRDVTSAQLLLARRG